MTKLYRSPQYVLCSLIVGVGGDLSAVKVTIMEGLRDGYMVMSLNTEIHP